MFESKLALKSSQIPNSAGNCARGETLKVNRKGPMTREARRQFAAAESAWRGGDYPRSISLLGNLIERDPSHLPALELLARNLWRVGSYEELVTTMHRLLALNPYEPGYLALLGSGLQALGRYGEAADAFERSTEIPGCAEALSDLRSWQNHLVRELLESDRGFRTRFRQNAVLACAERGLRLQLPTTGRLLVEPRETAHYTRPS